MSASAPPLHCREPFRILFPLGALLAWAGILPWLLLATRVDDSYRVNFHALAQIEGFLACFAAGFLLTLIPRRTRTAPAAPWQVAVLAACPIATVTLAWLQRWTASQVPWLIFLAVLTGFALRRFLAAGAGRRIPSSFVWVVLGLAMAIAAVLVTALADHRGLAWLHDVGRAMTLQGLFSALILGIAPLLVPQITRGEMTGEGSTRARLAHAAGALIFFGAFWIEAWSRPLGLALRAGVALGVILFAVRGWRLPTLPGLHRWLVWLAVWLLPAGYAFAALEPDWLTAALHLTFIGSFGLLVLSISLHVVGTHAGDEAPLRRWPPPVIAMAALLLLAGTFRVLVRTDGPRFYLWLGLASSCFLAATVCWGFFVLPRLMMQPPRSAHP